METELDWTSNVGAIHHARWMAAAIYVLKMFFCGRNASRWAKGLLDLVYFIICLYGRYWFAAPLAADAPFLTLSLCKDLHRWATRDLQLAAKLLRIFDWHTWYVNARNVIYALFSGMVDDSTKGKIAAAMLLPDNAPCDLPPGKPALPPITPETNLEDVVDCESWNLFRVSAQKSHLHLQCCSNNL